MCFVEFRRQIPRLFQRLDGSLVLPVQEEREAGGEKSRGRGLGIQPKRRLGGRDRFAGMPA